MDKIKINGTQYTILGRAVYATKGDPDATYVKVTLNDNKSLLIVPSDKVAFIGENKGHIKEFDGFPNKATFNGEELEQSNHDFQIKAGECVGVTEGECEFWDYTNDNLYVSVAVLADGTRADVILNEIDYELGSKI